MDLVKAISANNEVPRNLSWRISGIFRVKQEMRGSESRELDQTTFLMGNLKCNGRKWLWQSLNELRIN
ncbi:hypothetical protein OK016_27870 [Vibrio chagasii]|nr:hypothetical protein [Vibrio chagasii]